MASLTKGTWSSVLLISVLLNSVAAGNHSDDLTQFVDPFIGTEGQGYPGTAINSGNVFPGAALPFGVVKFGIDTTAFDWTNVDADAGYTPDGYGKNAWCLNRKNIANT
jgi:putative alpha-1,2-mannosidase